LPDTVRQLCRKAGVAVSDIKLLVPHQANKNILAVAADELGLPLSRVAINIDRYGNTLAASIPIALDEALAAGKAGPGDLVGLGWNPVGALTPMFAATAHAVRRWSEVKTTSGRRAAWQWAIDRIGSRLANLTVSEVVALERTEVKLPGPPPAGYDFRFLTAEEIARYSADVTCELADEHVARARAGSDLCFAAISGDRLAAYGWYALHCVEARHCDGIAISYPADMAYMYKGFTHPDFRGQRLHGYIMGLALAALHQERGIERLVSTVSWLNEPSLKSCDRLGYRRQGRMIALGWFGRKTGLYPSAARRLGVQFATGADLSSRSGFPS
jgi:hypothetical protein